MNNMKSIELLNKINNHLKGFDINLDTINKNINIINKYPKTSTTYNLIRIVDLYKYLLQIKSKDYY